MQEPETISGYAGAGSDFQGYVVAVPSPAPPGTGATGTTHLLNASRAVPAQPVCFPSPSRIFVSPLRLFCYVGASENISGLRRGGCPRPPHPDEGRLGLRVLNASCAVPVQPALFPVFVPHLRIAASALPSLVSQAPL
jgi:hypothetical protein